MNTPTTPRIVSKNISTEAGNLVSKERFKELLPTSPYRICNTLFINTVKRTFWFTTKETAEATLKLVNF